MHKKSFRPDFSYKPFEFNYELHHVNGNRWSISVKDRDFVVKLTYPEGEVKLTKNRAFCHEELRLLLFQEILKARDKGYTLPQALTQKELMEQKTIPSANVNYFLEGDHHEKILYFDSDLYVEGDLNMLSLYEHADALVVHGNLIVNGGIYNPEGDFGADLYITGKLLTDFLIIGGSEIRIDQDLLAHTLVLYYYNHGKIDYGNLGTSLFLDNENSDVYYNNFRWSGIGHLLRHIGVQHDFIYHLENRTPPPEGIPLWNSEMKEYSENTYLDVSRLINRLTRKDHQNGRIYIHKLLFESLPSMIEEGLWYC